MVLIPWLCWYMLGVGAVQISGTPHNCCTVHVAANYFSSIIMMQAGSLMCSFDQITQMTGESVMQPWQHTP